MKRNSPAACYHGGAFFDAIGVEFEHRHDIINGDEMGRYFAGRAAQIAVKEVGANRRMLEILGRVNNRLLSKAKSLSSFSSLQPA